MKKIALLVLIILSCLGGVALASRSSPIMLIIPPGQTSPVTLGHVSSYPNNIFASYFFSN